MNYSVVSVQTLQKFFAVIAVLAMVFGPISNVQFARADHDPFGGLVQTTIDLCHWDNNFNPAPDVNVNSIVGGGHSGHDNDIIPPFHYITGGGPNATTTTFAGQNWNGWDGGVAPTPELQNQNPQAIWSNNCVAEVPVATYVDLSITKLVNDSTPESGDTLTYTITVTNNGTQEATNVLVSDTLETGLIYVQSTPTHSNTDPLQWNLGTIATGTSEVITVEVTVGTETEGLVLTNEVSVTPDEDDSDIDDNTASVDVEVVTPISGCTDRSALNWDDSATVDDGSCEYICEYSDVTTTGNGVPSVLTFVHDLWTDEFDGGDAEWIWASDGAQNVTFSKSFYADSAATGTLKIAVDNIYSSVTLNGNPLSCDGAAGNNHSVADTCEVSVEAGLNTLVVLASNLDGVNNPPNNPAGLIFELTTVGSECTPAVSNPGSITIVKEFAGDIEPAQWSFDFTGALGDFTLENGDTSAVFNNLDEGEYLVNEIVPTGWATPSVSCTDGSGAGQGDDQLVVVLSEGEDVTCTFTNRELPPEPTQCLDVEENLLQNASFENPTVTANGGQWENFAAVANWTLLADGLELWKGLFGGASAGLQNAELDGSAAAPTSISQIVTTVVGNDYKLTYDFAARPNTNLANNVLEVVIDGVVVDTISEDGTGDGSIVWDSYTYEFTAASTSTKIEFRDAGTDDGFGTLLDNTALCLTEDNEVETYRIFGQVWHDENENDERDFFEDESSEDILEGWLITITDNDEFIATTTSDEFGNYEFEVPAGEYVITQTTQEGWALTYPNDGFWEVCVPVACGDLELSLIEEVLNFIIPTAHAAVAGNNGPLNFGNVLQTPSYSQGSYGGGGNGTRVELRDGGGSSDDEDEPTPQVLGESTSVVPVGAPNTGAGGAAPMSSFGVHTVTAILATRHGVRNGK